MRALSSQGAIGLMQIMPDTWADLRARHRLGADPYDPRDNILAGAVYLREMHDRYGVSGFLAAYNAGPRRYDDYLAAGRELPAETRRYVDMLAPLNGEEQVNNAATLNRRVMTWREAPLFAARTRESPQPCHRLGTRHRSEHRPVVMLAVHLCWRRQLMVCAPRHRKSVAVMRSVRGCRHSVEGAHEASRPKILNHGLRPVIGVLRVMPVTINSPVRLLLVLLP